LNSVAGLAISEKLRSDIRVLQQGLRNLNDGLSLVNVMEAALNEQTDMIIRMRELAAQAASATLGPSERSLLQLEVNALVAEINRFAAATEFNGQKLLDGSFTSLIVHFGVDASANSQLDIAAAAGFTANSVDMAFILTGTGTPFTATQTANFGGIILGANSTGLANDATVYSVTITVDGTAQTISFAGSTAQTFNALETAIDTPLTGATATIVGGNIVITSATTGATSSISIADSGANPLFAALAVTGGFIGFDPAGAGPPATTTLS